MRGGIAIAPRLPLKYLALCARQAWPLFAAIIILFIFARTFYVLTPWFLGQIVDGLDFVLRPSTEAADWSKVWRPLSLLIGLSLIARGILLRCMMFMLYRAVATTTLTMRCDLLDRAKDHPLSYFQSQMSGALSSKITTAADTLYPLIENSIFIFFGTLLTYVVSFIILIKINAWLAIILLFWLLLFLLPCLPLSRRLLRLSSNEAEKRNNLTGFLVDLLTNIATVKSFARMRNETATFRIMAEDARTSQLDKYRLSWRLNVIQEIGYVVLASSLLITLVFMIRAHHVTLGDFAVIVPTAMQVCDSTWTMAISLTSLFQDFGSIRTALDAVEQPNDLIESSNAESLLVKAGAIKLDHVSFSYTSGHSIFKNLNLSVKPREKLALVGLSGAGKSTLIALLQRLYDVSSGSISIDGTDIRTVTLDSLRSNIALVPQDITLFNRTLMDNIRYGDPSASDDQVKEAARQAQIHDLIEYLPQGYNTLTGERGVKLSGGQRQRIAIARAFLKNAPILILDESTSALDSETEQAVQASLKTLMQGRTVIAIAHRLATIRNYDRLILLENGRITGDGPHDQLIETSTFYNRLWQKQLI